MKAQHLLNSFWLVGTIGVFIAQPVRADVIEITSVQVKPTQNGIEIILQTASGKSSPIFISNYSNRVVADIVNTQLRLPTQGNTFRQDNPTDQIASISVSSLDSNSIRVVVIGKAGVSTNVVQSNTSSELPQPGIILNLATTPGNAATKPAPTAAPNSEQVEDEIAQTEPQADETDADIEVAPTVEDDSDADIEVEVTGQRDPLSQTSSPEYVIDREEIQKQGANSLAETLRGLPGFAINDAGFGADIHTGTYYRGNSINQSVFLLNGRPINTNINTYHGATDLNSIPVESIEKVELSSGTSSTLYGSEAFGGVVNIVTRQGSEIPRINGLAEFGSFEQENYRANFGGTTGNLRYNVGYEKYDADNNYRVPRGAANRDPETG